MSGLSCRRFPRIAHIITDLNGFGGTEATLLRYLKGSEIPSEFHRIIVLKTIGVGETLGAQMVNAGFSVVELNQQKGNISLQGMKDLFHELREFNPDVISAWLYHPSLLATILALFLPRHTPVIWHIRSLPFSSLVRAPGRYIVQRVLALLSHFTNPLIVSNSGEAIRQHVSLGFGGSSKQHRVIPNGIELDHYYYDRNEGLAVRHELGIPTDAIVIGCVGRFVAEKGYPVLFAALKIVQEKLNSDLSARVHLLGVGNGVSLENASFVRISSDALDQSRLHFLDKRSDVPRLLRTLDLFVLPSISEAFPNALIEAMATGVACVATDVGQCTEVLGNPDFIVTPSDSLQLADRIVKLIELGAHGRFELGVANRQRVAGRYKLIKMVRSFDELFCDASEWRR